MKIQQTKWLVLFWLVFGLACSTSTKKESTTENVSTEVKAEESQVLDSLSKKVDTAKAKIDQTSKELDDLMKDISK